MKFMLACRNWLQLSRCHVIWSLSNASIGGGKYQTLDNQFTRPFTIKMMTMQRD